MACSFHKPPNREVKQMFFRFFFIFGMDSPSFRKVYSNDMQYVLTPNKYRITNIPYKVCECEQFVYTHSVSGYAWCVM